MESAQQAFRYRLRPSRTQARKLEEMAHARRFAWNWGLERWQRYYRETGGTIAMSALMRELTRLKKEPGHEWLYGVDSQLLQQALFDLRQAYRNFFERRARYPRFKSRKMDAQRFRIPQRVRVEGSRVYVPKVGWVRAWISRPVEGETRSATFKRDARGRWFVSLVADRPLPAAPSIVRGAVGVDLGILDFAVLSDGGRVPNPRFELAARRRLRREHRALSRKRRGSRNRAKAAARLARLHGRIADQRHDFIHKLTTGLVDDFGLIVIEDLGVTGMARTKLAGALRDSPFHEFRRQLVYKTAWRGTHLRVVDRFFPSSKRCSECGAVTQDLARHRRRWTCGCGTAHDRDLNAVRNLLAVALGEVAVGRTDTRNACGARVRPSMRATGGEAGIRKR